MDVVLGPGNAVGPILGHFLYRQVIPALVVAAGEIREVGWQAVVEVQPIEADRVIDGPDDPLQPGQSRLVVVAAEA